MNLIDENESHTIPQTLTVIDYEMQKQAYMTQLMYLNISKNNDSELFSIISTLWDGNYHKSLFQMKNCVDVLTNSKSTFYLDTISDLSKSIVSTKKTLCDLLGYQNDFVEMLYSQAIDYFDHDDFEKGFDYLILTFQSYSDMLK
jgi:hypothetical protein